MTTFNALVQHFQCDLVYSIAGLVNNTLIAPMRFNGLGRKIFDQGTKAWSRCYYG
ncbi:hypothetical protein [Holospora elegans]|uniref:hypothetical protein n=1 Tax=Holospora elegans TaxID=431043 RepID=UPI00139F2C93|nr:hypothetical protein [Holospora elegans]